MAKASSTRSSSRSAPEEAEAPVKKKRTKAADATEAPEPAPARAAREKAPAFEAEPERRASSAPSPAPESRSSEPRPARPAEPARDPRTGTKPAQAWPSNFGPPAPGERPERVERPERQDRPDRAQGSESRGPTPIPPGASTGISSLPPGVPIPSWAQGAVQQRQQSASQGSQPAQQNGGAPSYQSNRNDAGRGEPGSSSQQQGQRDGQREGQGQQSSSGGSNSGQGGNGGNGGGGGGNAGYQPRPYQSSQGPSSSQGQMSSQSQMMQGGRRKKKKRKGGSGLMPGGGGGGGGGSYGPGPSWSHGPLPSDEEIDREAQALERLAGTPEYAQAEKNALHMSELQRMEIGKLHEFAAREGLTEFHKLPRQELIFQLLKKKAAETGLIFGEGTLEIAHEGYGFLRSPEQSYLSSPDDIYVSPSMVRRLAMRKGMDVKGAIRPPKEGERYFTLLRVDSINNHEPSKARQLPIFEDLTPLHPEQRFVLETTPDEIEMRIVDLVAPIGRGQRGLIVAPPRTGKTVLLQKITKAINKNYPEVKIMVLLIDERPEEVTDFRRNTSPTVEVVASTFDEDSSRHVAVAEMVIEKARRYVEYGQHVVILLDSITRLARAYNAAQPHSGKIMTGGIDSNALVRPKKFFGSARAIEKGGSLTILGTALVDTGSKADEVIFEEFKGTGNSELHLDRKLVDKRIWPAIDVAASGTRREELLLDKKELELTYRLRKVLSDMNVVEAMELMKGRLKKAKTNAEFLMTMNIGA